jgi:aspartyl-tRNA synthetase
MLRTYTCGELTNKSIGNIITLTGWVASRRNVGALIFLDLRDRYGVTQITLDPSRNNEQLINLAQEVGVKWVLSVTGKVVARPESMVNTKMITRAIEIETTKMT